MIRGTPGLAACIASLFAGPMFLLFVAGAELYLQLPKPIEIPAYELVQLTALMPVALAFGFLLAFIPNVLGAGLMGALSDHYALARLPIVWAGAGALCGFGIARAFDPAGQMSSPAFALIATSAACATICWWHMILSPERRLRRRGQ